jgi:hypothetical protein
MAALNGFDASTVPEQESFDALPEGQYVAIITESEFKPTKNGQGQYLQFVFEVIDGQFKGRKLWARLNLQNHNKTAVDIAQRELGAICRAVGIIRPNDSAELHNKAMLVTVGVELDDRNRQANIIKKYESAIGGAPAMQHAPAPAPAAQAAPATAPWGQQPAPAPAPATPNGAAPWQ